MLSRRMMLAGILASAVCPPTFAQAGTYKRDLHLMATTAYYEARSDGVRGMLAVCLVIRNRMKDQRSTVGDVVREKDQFSVWNRRGAAHGDKPSREDPHYRQALKVAHAVLTGKAKDVTRGSTHYHEVSIRPVWAPKLRPTVRVGRHQFYR